VTPQSFFDDKLNTIELELGHSNKQWTFFFFRVHSLWFVRALRASSTTIDWGNSLVVLCSGLETSELNDNVDAPRKEGRRWKARRRTGMYRRTWTRGTERRKLGRIRTKHSHTPSVYTHPPVRAVTRASSVSRRSWAEKPAIHPAKMPLKFCTKSSNFLKITKSSNLSLNF
jgi:hypothetical protein